MLSKERLELFLELEDELYDTVSNVLTNKVKLETGKDYQGAIEKIDIEGNTVSITTEDRDDDKYYYSFPTEYLYDETWIEKVKKELEEKEKIKQLERANLLQQQTEATEKRERELYEELKKKFG